MSKVICDICGTSYPDTAEECPTCGYSNSDTVDFVEEESAIEAEEMLTHTPTKGGHFSKGNVSKRNKPSKKSASKAVADAKGKGSERGLIIAVFLLLIGILLVGAYIYFNYFAPEKKEEKDPFDDILRIFNNDR